MTSKVHFDVGSVVSRRFHVRIVLRRIDCSASNGVAMPNAPKGFQLIDPISPPPQRGPLSCLGPYITECSTWLFNEPIASTGRAVFRQVEEPSITNIIELTHIARNLLDGKDVSTGVSSSDLPRFLENDGQRLVDYFCDRFVRGSPNLVCKLRSGRTVGQRDILCAAALLIAENAAKAIRENHAARTAATMADLGEVVCEIRRTLDRDAGADVKRRLARKRWEKMSQVRAKAIELYRGRKWKSVRQAATKIYQPVCDFARDLGVTLSAQRGELTVYEWLLKHSRTVAI